MEELTRTQTVLLCVLVSFVTSIGTGIITVSLLQEAPAGVTQTINQVVERTVERVVPGPSRETVKEVTVVVKEEDLVIDSIKKNEKSLVRIAQATSGGGSSGGAGGSQNIVALGLVVSTDGNILVDRRAISEGNSFVAIFQDGRQFPVKLVSSSLPSSSNYAGNIPNSAYLETVRENKDSGYVFFPAVTASSDTLQLGQTIIALGGKTQSQVAIGRVSFLNFSDTATTTPTKSVIMIQTESSLKDEISGALLLNLNGELVGVEIWRPDAPSLPDQFTPFNMIRTAGAKFFAATQ